MLQKHIAALTLFTGLTLATACSKKDEAQPETKVNIAATIDASQQVQPIVITSSATGTLTGTYNTSSRLLTYNVVYQGFPAGAGPTAGHIHLGGPGVAGDVAVAFPQVTTSPITGSATLTQAQGDKLLANGMYVNLHTLRYGNGEIRGNIVAENPNIVRLAATINGYNQTPSNNSPATGVMSGTFDKTTRLLTYTVAYDGFPAGAGPNAGHFHVTTPGMMTGDVAVALASLASPVNSTTTLTTAQAAQLLAGTMYVNLHTVAFPNGEIRGNVQVL